MPRKPKTLDEITTELSESKVNNKLVKAQGKTDSDTQLSEIIGEKMLMLVESRKRGKVDLDSIDDVEACVLVYFESCRRKGYPPNFEGMASALGYSRQYLYNFIKSKKSDVSIYLDNCRTLFADIIQTASSKRILDCATSIFILKSMTGLGFTDKNDELPDTSDIDDSEYTSRDYKEKYRHLLALDLEE